MNSNTTLVKVKYAVDIYSYFIFGNSNTTLVKVKLKVLKSWLKLTGYSNTTLVKVKLFLYIILFSFISFKYNTC